MILKKDFRIVFMGTPDFAVASLKALVEVEYNIVGVITAIDKAAGRGKKLKGSAVKEYAVQNNLNLLQPKNLKDPDFVAELKALKADLQIVVAFRMLPEVVWNMPVYGTFNLHASLLPQYRGAAPINHCIINGESTTGLSTFFLDKEIDTGRIIKQLEIEVFNNDTAGTLHDRMMLEGADLVLQTVNLIIEGKTQSIDQSAFISPNIVLNPAPKIFKEDCEIDWTKPANEIYNFIRGLSPYPASFTSLLLNDKEAIYIKVYSSTVEIVDHKSEIGTILPNKGEIKVAVENGFIYLTEIQQSGKKRMAVSDFLRGVNLEDGGRVSLK